LAELGSLIGDHWIVEATLGRGGMGTVYRCHHSENTDIKAAIKVLAAQLREDDGARRRFVREAEVLARLEHPAVVQVRSVNAEADLPHMEMEFIEGSTLADRLEEGTLDADEAVALGLSLFDALHYLHDNKVQHRDIKPDNVILRTGGGLVLVDFGLALDAKVSRLTQHNVAFGTVAYAPPEWLHPSKLKPVAWDLYAAGVVLWELLTSGIPFPASGVGDARQQALQVMLSKQSAPPLDPGESFPPSLRVLIRELTHPRPDHRPESAYIVYRALVGVQTELQGEWDADATPPSTSRSYVMAIEEEATQVPPPFRNTAEWSSLEPGPLPTASSPGSEAHESWGPSVALLGAVALLLLAAAGTVVQSSVGDGEEMSIASFLGGAVQVGREVRMVVPALPDASLLTVKIDDRRPDSVEGDMLVFVDVDRGPHVLKWVYGADCETDVCPGDACGKWCGHDDAIQMVADGEEPMEISLAIEVPTRAVTVHVVAFENPKKKWGRKKGPPTLIGWLGDQKGVVEGADVLFEGVLPGRHPLRLTVGECGETRDCWPDGLCPEGCSNTEAVVVIGWGDTALTLPSELPLPP
jgi:serine/threonine protein kinase